MSRMPLHLFEHPEDFVIVRLEAGESPSWAWTEGPFTTVSRTGEETSIVCLAAGVPADARQEGPFRAVEVAGPLDFEMVGVLVEMLEPLARAGITVLAFSTFDTDWLLIPAERIRDAADAWRKAGLIVTPSQLGGRS